MIIANLKGGLGNQMFQYACGRALALRNNDPDLRLYVDGLERANMLGDVYRPYSLGNFNIKAEIAISHEAIKLRYPYGAPSKLWQKFKTKVLRQNHVGFSSRIFKLKKDVFLNGYFQTERYFLDYAKQIREDFTPKAISETANTIIKRVLCGNYASVSIHVRRGDYVGHKILGGICTIQYYERAVKKITELTNRPQFYIFSDDIEWTKNNLILPGSITYVSSKNLEDWEELIVMSSCRYNIIANSSFSWWAAWLNNHPQKIIITPKRWANGIFNKWKMRDIIPNSWIRI